LYARAPLTSARHNIHARALLLCLTATMLIVALPTPSKSHARSRSGLDSVERGVVREINKIRRASGLRRVRANRALSRGADYHCRDMLDANFFAHASSNGESFAQRVESFRPSARIGETLAYVPTADPNRSSRRIVEMWMNSPPHRASLLSSSFHRIGVARRKGTIGNLPVVVFTADFASVH
jgi:uncharacterized protein YkwD